MQSRELMLGSQGHQALMFSVVFRYKKRTLARWGRAPVARFGFCSSLPVMRMKMRKSLGEALKSPAVA